MKSVTSRRFRELYANLPNHIRLQARKAYQLFRANPSHPGLNFKKVDHEGNIYSARIGIRYRALARVDGEEVVWLWIGPHSDYDKIV